MDKFRNAALATILISGIVACVVFTTPSYHAPTIVHAPVTVVQPDKTPDERFKYAVGIVLRHEGGLSNDKADPGGITKYGLSLRFLKQEKLDIDGDGEVDKDDIIHLDLAEADELYAKYWWDKYHYNNIKDLTLATKVFDASVNMGPSEAHKILKRAMNHIMDLPIVESGDIDARTISLANHLNAKDLLENFRTEEKDVYMEIIERKPSLKVFESGWLRRAEE